MKRIKSSEHKKASQENVQNKAYAFEITLAFGKVATPLAMRHSDLFLL